MKIEDAPYAEWLEDGIKTIFHGKPVCIALVATLESGETVTGYYNADAQDKAVFAHHIQSDVTLDIIANNAGFVRAMLEESEDAD